MSEEKTMKVKELVDHILKHMTAEEALAKLLATQVEQYEKLKVNLDKIDQPGGSPYFIIIQAAMELGWDFMIEKDPETIRGLSIGTKEYFEALGAKKKEDSSDEPKE